jgi:hypothetical protein
MEEYEFTTIQAAEIIGETRMNIHEWSIQGYIEPLRRSEARGCTAIYDIHGLVAFEIFNRLRRNVRRPVAGRISKWYQAEGYKRPGDIVHCAIFIDAITMHDATDTGTVFQDADYVISIPLSAARQRIESRIKEILSHGDQSDRRIEAQGHLRQAI